jgi:hypothetical protein
MSILDIAMEKHMEYIVKVQGRPSSFQDFDHFEIDGKFYHVSQSTFRNKISHLMGIGKVIFQSKTTHAYYSLPNYDFTKQTMTQDHAGLPITISKQSPIYKLLAKLPKDRQALHDFRLTFLAPEIWEAFSKIFPNRIGNSNKDISLERWRFVDEIDVVVTIHHTNTVSIAISCSSRPIAIDVPDLFYLIEILTRTEIKIATYCSGEKTLEIPRYTEWIVKMWHFGIDDPEAYSGDAFHITVRDGMSDLWRMYTKRQNDGKLHLRGEHQEHPNKPIIEAILDKIYSGGRLYE